MQEDISVVLASNRGPFSFIRTPDGLQKKGAAGGASPALDAVARRLGERAFWVATAISDADREAVETGQAEALAADLGYGFRLLTFDPETYSGYYNEVSNRMLWYANHCLWDEVGIKSDDLAATAFEDAYEPVNRAFAAEVAKHITHGALVLFQDYHLATAAGHLRAAAPDTVISHFTHSSFCGPPGMAYLPEATRRAVIEGMLGSDLVGFHVGPWVEGFFRSCEELGATVDRGLGVVDHDDRRTWVRAYPIPIDAHDLLTRAGSETVIDWARRFSQWADGRVLIVRGDRAEPSKNIVRGFEALRLLMDRRPDLRDRIRFAACVYPSRQGLAEYRDYVQRIKDSAAALNDRYPGTIELYMNDDFDRTLGAYRVYDVLLVNPIMDGMNLVSKEGPALNERDGVVILSEGAGAYAQLGQHVVGISDPFDLRGTAAALERAIDLPAEDRKRHAVELRRLATASKPGEWIEAQIDDLTEVAAGRPPTTPAASVS